jgi:N-methylhydantoinase B
VATATTPDRFTLEIIRSYLISTVQEMSEATKRSAYSTVISEALDFTCGLFDAGGRMVAQVAGLPLFAGTLPAAMRAIMDRFDDFDEGDVFLISDPYVAGLHQSDVVVIRPIFVDDELLAFAANRAHWLDVGGMAAGGWAGTATHVVQEGLRIPAIRIIRRGEVDEPMRDLILANVRLPRADWGDFQSQVASTLTAEKRLRALTDRHGREVVEAGFRSALEYSRTRFLAGLAELPHGSWKASEVIEDDGRGGGPYEIRVTVTASPEQITADFTASDPQVDAPVNCTHISALSAVCTACIAVVDPDVPLNDGFLDLIELVTEPGTIVHPVFPAPVFFSTADPSNKVCEAVLKSFAQVVPERVSAGSYQTGNNVTGAGVDDSGRPFQWFSFGAGGLGARYDKDGENGEWHLMGNCTNESIEIWETRYPLRFEEFSLIPDSGGQGKYRGGLGYRRRIRMLKPTAISSIADRQQIPPWGVEGGEPGKPNQFTVVDNEGRKLSIPERFGTVSSSKFANLALEPGEQLILESGGGGGFGPPGERSPAARARDEEFGYTTASAP